MTTATLNLDAMSADELEAVRDAYRAMGGLLAEEHPYAEFACRKLLAIQNRERGDERSALVYEIACDHLYYRRIVPAGLAW